MKTEVKVICQNCQSTVDVTDALVSQFQESIREDLQNELAERENRLQDQRTKNQELFKKLNQERDEIEETIRRKVRTLIRTREVAIKNDIRQQIQEEKDAQLKELEEELKSKNAQVIELNVTKAKMERQNQEFEAQKSQIILDKERELSERLSEAKASISEQLKIESSLKLTEKQELINSLKKQLQIATQKAEQGSMQLQGESQELVLEEILRQANPTDTIEEIGKGIRGGDCRQIIVTQNGIQTGKILYESKRTKNWSDSFIKKLKQDNLTEKADIMVIVTSVMPNGMDGKYALIDGVWITTLVNVRDLSLMLRFGLLKTYAVMISQNGRKDKMSLLYNYLTSEEFRSTFESILEGFTSLQNSHFDEQKKMQLLWKKRAKTLEEILSSTIEFYGSIKSIGGASIEDIKMLEFKQAS